MRSNVHISAGAWYHTAHAQEQAPSTRSINTVCELNSAFVHPVNRIHYLSFLCRRVAASARAYHDGLKCCCCCCRRGAARPRTWLLSYASSSTNISLIIISVVLSSRNDNLFEQNSNGCAVLRSSRISSYPTSLHLL
jgi:hypothetical protein